MRGTVIKRFKKMPKPNDLSVKQFKRFLKKHWNNLSHKEKGKVLK